MRTFFVMLNIIALFKQLEFRQNTFSPFLLYILGFFILTLQSAKTKTGLFQIQIICDQLYWSDDKSECFELAHLQIQNSNSVYSN